MAKHNKHKRDSTPVPVLGIVSILASVFVLSVIVFGNWWS